MAKRIVIIPTYNEIENIARIVESIFSLPVDFHVLVVDDSSPDGTAKAVIKLQQKYPEQLFLELRKKKEGIGKAYIHGFKWALKKTYSHIFEMDADFSHNPEDLPRLYEACVAENAGVAIGSRYLTGVNVVNWPMKRVLMSWLASKYVKFITRMDVQDTTAGFVCYHRKVLETIDLDKIHFVGYAFQIEMKFKAHLLGHKIIEIPIIFKNRTRGKSKMSGKIISEAVFGVITMKIKSLVRKRYGKVAD